MAHAAGLVLVDASHEDNAHEVRGMAPFVPLLATIGAYCPNIRTRQRYATYERMSAGDAKHATPDGADTAKTACRPPLTTTGVAHVVISAPAQSRPETWEAKCL